MSISSSEIFDIFSLLPYSAAGWKIPESVTCVCYLGSITKGVKTCNPLKTAYNKRMENDKMSRKEGVLARSPLLRTFIGSMTISSPNLWADIVVGETKLILKKKQVQDF